MSDQLVSSHPVPPAAWRWVSVPALLALVIAGTWFFGGVVAPGYLSSIVLTGAWIGVVGVLVLIVGRRVPEVRTPLWATFAVVAVLGGVGFYWTSIRDDRVNEVVATGVAASQLPPAAEGAPPPAAANVELARGSFVAKAHAGSGTAAFVELAGGGRRLTLTNFETDNGPDLFVYLTTGSVGGGVDDFVDLGRLKGNVGNQQYEIPQDVDLAKYTTVVIWCRAFSVNFAEARLQAS